MHWARALLTNYETWLYKCGHAIPIEAASKLASDLLYSHAADEDWQSGYGTCRLSELRIIELLGDLSEDLDAYKEVENIIDSPVQWQHKDFITRNATSLSQDETKYNKRLLKRYISWEYAQSKRWVWRSCLGCLVCVLEGFCKHHAL